MADAMLFYCYLCRDGCVKYSYHSCCGSCSLNHPFISSSDMADAMLFYCYLCRDGCVKYSYHLCCGSCSCTLFELSASSYCLTWLNLLATTFLESFLVYALFSGYCKNLLHGATHACILFAHCLCSRIVRLFILYVSFLQN